MREAYYVRTARAGWGIMGRVTHENARDGYKLILVPLEYVRTHSPEQAVPQCVTVAGDVLYEVAADVAADRMITMSRVFFEQQVEVIG